MTWALRKESSKTLLVWERRVLRSNYGIIKEGNRSNAELAGLYYKPDIKKGRLQWLGNVERMKLYRLLRKMLYDAPGGKEAGPG